MKKPKDIIIIGGGLIGLFCAHYLVKDGHRVTILDRAAIGSGAARGNGGWVCPSRSQPMASPGTLREGMTSWVDPASPLYIPPSHLPALASYLMRFARNSTRARFQRSLDSIDGMNSHTHQLFDALEQEGVGVPLDSHGYLSVFETRSSAEDAHRASVATAKRGLTSVPGEILGPHDLLALEPALGAAAKFGFRQHGDRWLDPSALVDKMIDSLSERGANFVPDHTVFSVEDGPHGVTVTTPYGVFEAETAILAAGAWSNDLLRRLGFNGMVVPGKGYSFSVRPPVLPVHNLQFGLSHVAGTPIGDKLRIVGTVEFDGTYDTLNRSRIDIMKRGASPFVRGVDWDNGVTDEWVAPRPMTPDGLPLIGALPGRERIIAATGHNMIGLTLGAATGVMVAGIVENGNTHANRAFDPARFTRRGTPLPKTVAKAGL